MTTDSVRNFVIIEVNRNERAPQCGAATIEVVDKEDLTMNNSHSEAYAAAGVDITAGYKSVELMKKHIRKTEIPGVCSDVGGFGGLFIPDLAGMQEPVLVSGTDGVGTKLKIAFLMNKHDTIGIDCVAMCVNDIICCGAKPLFFLDYRF